MKNITQYCRPSSPAEAIRLKTELGDEAVYLAGGTDLLVHRPSHVIRAIDIRHAGMDYAGPYQGDFAIGGACLLRDAERAMTPVAGGMLREALRETAPWVIRNAATVAGNIANASPAADSVPALLVLDTRLRVQGDSEQLIPLESILSLPHCTTLGNRLIVQILVPHDAAGRRAAFIKLGRSKSDIALVNVAVAFRLDGTVARDVRIALGAVAPCAVRARTVERVLEGETLSPQVIAEAARMVHQDITPISDWRASADYRSRMSELLVGRALQRAVNQTQEGG